MKLLFCVILGLVALAFAFWVVVVPANPLSTSAPIVLAVILVFVVSPMGSFWMIYMAVRHEKQPLPMVFLAFLPFASIWYYSERVRHGRHLAR